MPTGIYPRTKEHNRKLSLAHLGKKFSKKRKLEHSKALKRAYKNGTKISSKGSKRSLLQRNKISLGNIRTWSLNYDKRLTSFQKKVVGRKHTLEARSKIKYKALGRHWNDEMRRRFSLIHGGTGVPYEFSSYPKEFREIKKFIRLRDNYTCQNCGMTEEEHLKKLKQVLSIHHIDYDKNNCNPKNLMASCRPCNSKFNSNRLYWSNLLRKE